MTNSVDVTVIVPTYNRAEYLGDSLASLLGQTRPPQQLIVVDDGSTDGTPEVIASFGTAVERHRQANAGKSTALNLALSHARGEAVWIFDDDDVAVPDALEVLSAGLDAHPSAGFAFGTHANFSAPGEPLAPRAPSLAPSLDLDDLFHGVLTRQVFVFQGAMLVRRRCYDEVGPFDPTFARAQDFDMLTRLAARFEAAQVDRVVLHQRQHTGDRGPQRRRIDGREVWHQQYEFDVAVARKVHGTLPPEVFLARRDRSSAQAGAGALLRRAAVMLAWGLWAEASQDLRTLGAAAPASDSVPVDLAAAFRDGAERMGPAVDEGGQVLDDALSLPPSRVRDELVAVLLWPTLRQALKAVLRGRVRSLEAQALWRRRGRVPSRALLCLGRVGAERLAGGIARRAGRSRAGPG